MRIKDVIYKSLKDAIVLEELMPGERIIELDITKKFNCSRGPAREAIVQLYKGGFVDLNENKGAVVKKISAEEIANYYQLLGFLEGKVVNLATGNLKDSDLKKLATINNSLRELDPEDPDYLDEWCVRNTAFHEVFRERCGNKVMTSTIKEVKERIYRYRYRSLLSTKNEYYIKDHEKILECVGRNDSEAAGNEMESHILRARDVLLRYLTIDRGGAMTETIN